MDHSTHEFQASSVPGRTSPDPSNTMPPLSTNNGSHNIYGCMVDVSKLTSEQRQQHAVMLLQNYHELCNKNDPSSMFVSPPPIPNIESLSQSKSDVIGSSQSSISSNKTTHELQASSMPGRTSPDPSNTMPPPSIKNGSCKIYGWMHG